MSMTRSSFLFSAGALSALPVMGTPQRQLPEGLG